MWHPVVDVGNHWSDIIVLMFGHDCSRLYFPAVTNSFRLCCSFTVFYNPFKFHTYLIRKQFHVALRVLNFAVLQMFQFLNFPVFCKYFSIF